MAWSFSDSFDCYAAAADGANGYWDSVAGAPPLVAGRFVGSQALQLSNTPHILVKTSAVNDALHHFVVAFRQTAAISGTTLGTYFQLLDGATGQCAVVFRSDGAILLNSGTAGGTNLATYTGAFPVTNTWYAFEIEVFISNTAGYMNVRKNGNVVNDFTSATNLDTQNSANAYANKLTISQQTSVSTQQLDDLYWRSDASSVAWMGDIKCIARAPASDASVQFSRTPTSAVLTPAGVFNTSPAVATGTARYSSFTATYDGTIGTATIFMTTGYTGNMKCSIFASSGTAPTTVLGSANVLVNPATGSNALTFAAPIAITKGTQYWIGFSSDTSSGAWFTTATSTGTSSTTSYASFPVASPTTSTAGAISCTLTLTVSSNSTVVNEAQQDATTSYVYDSVPGHADFYGIAAIASTPLTTFAVVTRAYMIKSDAGTRTAAVQLKSGSGALAPTIWNAGDSTNVTLSGSSLTATASGAGGVRSLVSKSSGKHYWEVLANTFSFSSATGIGAANASALLANMGSTGINAVFVYQNGQVYVNGSNVGFWGGGSVTAGARVCIALDLGAFLIWYRSGAGGTWNNNGSADPATGVGGFSVASIFSGAIPAFAAFAGGPSGDGVTANFGGSAFTGAVPSGFTAGLGGIVGLVTSPTVVLTPSNWQWAWRHDTVDPNTSSAWTAAAVNTCTVGPVVIA